jgi:hypothetical protein
MILHRFCLCEKFHGHTPVRVWTETKNFVDLRFFDPEVYAAVTRKECRPYHEISDLSR